MCIDIEIRKITTDKNPFFKVIVYDVTIDGNTEPLRTVRDIFHADDYQTAVTLLPKILLGEQPK